MLSKQDENRHTNIPNTVLPLSSSCSCLLQNIGVSNLLGSDSKVIQLLVFKVIGFLTRDQLYQGMFSTSSYHWTFHQLPQPPPTSCKELIQSNPCAIWGVSRSWFQRVLGARLCASWGSNYAGWWTMYVLPAKIAWAIICYECQGVCDTQECLSEQLRQILAQKTVSNRKRMCPLTHRLTWTSLRISPYLSWWSWVCGGGQTKKKVCCSRLY